LNISSAQLLHRGRHVGECALTCSYAAAERAKVFKLSCEYLHIYNPRVEIFAEKKAKLHD